MDNGYATKKDVDNKKLVATESVNNLYSNVLVVNQGNYKTKNTTPKFCAWLK